MVTIAYYSQVTQDHNHTRHNFVSHKNIFSLKYIFNKLQSYLLVKITQLTDHKHYSPHLSHPTPSSVPAKSSTPPHIYNHHHLIYLNHVHHY